MITNKEYKNFQDAGYTVLPMSRKIIAPGETPLSLYSKIADQQNNFLFVFILYLLINNVIKN